MNKWFGLYGPLLWLGRKILFLWVRTKVLPDDLDSLRASGKSVCYVLDLSGSSNLMVLDQVCETAQLPRPVDSIANIDAELPAVMFMRRLYGIFVRRADPRMPKELENLVRYADEHPATEIDVIPVSIFWGRSPDKENSSLKLLFSDSWSIVGRIRKLMTILIHGRNTFVQFSPPVSVRALTEEGLGHQRAARKLSRVLRVHFRRLRIAAIGPDLSHRRNLVNQLLSTPDVKKAIAREVTASGKSVETIEAKARKYAKEIAADYSYPVIRFFDLLLGWLWNKLYRGVDLSHFELLHEAAPGNEIIYVPCHRSHIDYMLLSYVLYQKGLVPPHIAAGINLNLPLVGPLLRRAGAFFVRRSFRGNRLYARIFDAYLSSNIARGVTIKYFIEGTRSRTGRLLTPKAGLLAMTVRSFLRDHRRPIVFVPVYIGYERLIEGRTYFGELSGKKKQRESLGGIFRSLGILRTDFGKVYVNIGRPQSLGEYLDRQQPGWQGADYSEDDRPEFLNSVVDKLGRTIMVEINRSAAVTPVNLLALALLSTPKHAMTENDLASQLVLYRDILTHAPYSDLITLPDMDGAAMIAHGNDLGVLTRREHPLGDVISLTGTNAVLMTYYRNNVLHLFALPAMIACCFLDNRSMGAEEITRLCRLVYPFVRRELFIRWRQSELDAAVARMIDVLVDLQILWRDPATGEIVRPASRSLAAVQLRVLSQGVMQTLERFYLAIALLLKHGSGRISQPALEVECQQTAERMSLLHEFNAPEFFDRALFRGFLNELVHRGVLTIDEQKHLCFDEQIRSVEQDAETVLGEQIRHSILQVTHV